MLWEYDVEFDYPNGDNPLVVHWNLDDDDIEINLVEWNDGNDHYTGDELWEMDYELAENIMSYIDNEFLHSEDFWLTKHGYDF